MRTGIGARVETSDGKSAGHIKYLILDSRTRDVRAMVVEKGLFLHTDREIGLNDIRSAEQSTIVLNRTAQELNDCPEFDSARYEALPVDYWTPADYAPSSLAWPAVTPIPGSPFGMAGNPLGASLTPDDAHRILPRERVEPDAVEEAQHKSEQAAAVIGEGSAVYTVDGQHIGDVRTLSLDPETGHITELVIREGWLFSRDFQVPASYIAGVDDRVIRLTIDQDTLEKIAGGDMIFT